MDYFSIVILVIVAFTFTLDRKMLDINTISKKNPKIKSTVRKLIKKLNVIKCDMETITYNSLMQIAETKKKYILLVTNMLNLEKEQIEVLVANYIVSNKVICGYNLRYIYSAKREFLKGIYVNGINYLNVFDRRNK